MLRGGNLAVAAFLSPPVGGVPAGGRPHPYGSIAAYGCAQTLRGFFDTLRPPRRGGLFRLDKQVTSCYNNRNKLLIGVSPWKSTIWCGAFPAPSLTSRKPFSARFLLPGTSCRRFL